MNASYRTTGRDLAAVLSALSAAPHTGHRKAEEAMERMGCAHCKGEGLIEPENNGPIGDCPVCKGTGYWPPEPSPDLPESEADKRADDAWYERDADRYLMDLNREDA